MKKILFSILSLLSLTVFTYGQLTPADVNILFDGSTIGSSADDWKVDNDGTNHMSTLDILDGVVQFNLNTNHASWYPNLGEFYPGGNIDCSSKTKLMIRVKLPETPQNFKVEPLAIALDVIDGSASDYGWEVAVGDTVRLNSGTATNSNPEFAAADLATGGDWQTIEYEVGNWHSTFPAKSVRMDSTKVIGVRVYYGWNAGDAALTALISVDWAVFVAPATTAADVETFMSGGGSSIHNSTISNGEIYPNPVNDILKINAENGSVVNLMDITGKVIESFVVNGSSVEFNTNSYNNGIYFVEFNYNGQSSIKKVVFN